MKYYILMLQAINYDWYILYITEDHFLKQIGTDFLPSWLSLLKSSSQRSECPLWTFSTARIKGPRPLVKILQSFICLELDFSETFWSSHHLSRPTLFKIVWHCTPDLCCSASAGNLRHFKHCFRGRDTKELGPNHPGLCNDQGPPGTNGLTSGC